MRIDFRKMSHGNSSKEIVNRTPDDNRELGEYSAETFKNRKGGINNIPDEYSDIYPDKPHKKPTKPKGGTRDLKGSKTIRRPEEEEDDAQ